MSCHFYRTAQRKKIEAILPANMLQAHPVILIPSNKSNPDEKTLQNKSRACKFSDSFTKPNRQIQHGNWDLPNGCPGLISGMFPGMSGSPCRLMGSLGLLFLTSLWESAHKMSVPAQMPRSMRKAWVSVCTCVWLSPSAAAPAC